MVNGLLLNGCALPPSTVYVPALPAERPVKVIVAVPSALPDQETGLTVIDAAMLGVPIVTKSE